MVFQITTKKQKHLADKVRAYIIKVNNQIIKFDKQKNYIYCFLAFIDSRSINKRKGSSAITKYRNLRKDQLTVIHGFSNREEQKHLADKVREHILSKSTTKLSNLRRKIAGRLPENSRDRRLWPSMNSNN